MAFSPNISSLKKCPFCDNTLIFDISYWGDKLLCCPNKVPHIFILNYEIRVCIDKYQNSEMLLIIDNSKIKLFSNDLEITKKHSLDLNDPRSFTKIIDKYMKLLLLK